MSNKSAGLSFQEAFEQAQAEVAAEEANSQVASTTELETPIVSEVEQPAVETEGKEGLFGDLAPEIEERSEQPVDLDSQVVPVTIDGETKMVTVKEARLGYQRQEDYTKGRQEIAKLKEEYSKAITLWEALESDYVKTVEALMSRAGIRGKVAPKGTAPAQEDIESLVETKLQEKLASDPRIQAFEQEQSIRQIEAIFANIEDQFNVQLTQSDKQAVLERAQAEQTTDLKYVVYIMLQEREQRLAAKKNLELVSTVTGQRSGGAAEPIHTQTEYFNTPAAAWAAALADEGNL